MEFPYYLLLYKLENMMLHWYGVSTCDMRKEWSVNIMYSIDNWNKLVHHHSVCVSISASDTKCSSSSYKVNVLCLGSMAFLLW
jgi:hypothetical protein